MVGACFVALETGELELYYKTLHLAFLISNF